MRRLIFAETEYYHIYNRGLDKRDLFSDKNDYNRFIQSVYYFNDENFSPENFDYQGLTLIKSFNRDELVNVIAWCLMPNHYHFVLKQKIDGGVTKFMRRLGTGYTMYANTKYERNGHVFQGPFKAKTISDNEYLQHVIRYIHLNPLDLIESSWKEKGIKNKETSRKFLVSYNWSSLKDYTGHRHFPEITGHGIPEEIFTDDPGKYLNFLWEWIDSGIPQELNHIKV